MNATPLPKTSTPAQRALEAIGITTLEQLADHTEDEILALHGMGPKALAMLKVALNELQLGFKDPTG